MRKRFVRKRSGYFLLGFVLTITFLANSLPLQGTYTKIQPQDRGSNRDPTSRASIISEDAKFSSISTSIDIWKISSSKTISNQDLTEDRLIVIESGGRLKVEQSTLRMASPGGSLTFPSIMVRAGGELYIIDSIIIAKAGTSYNIVVNSGGYIEIIRSDLNSGSSSEHGIVMYGGKGKIKQNDFYHTTKSYVADIFLSQCNGVELSGNTLGGIKIRQCYDIYLRNNRIEVESTPFLGSQTRGISIEFSNNIIITDNTIRDHNPGYGIYVDGSPNAKIRISNNDITNNQFGIKLHISSDILIYHNNFIENDYLNADDSNPAANNWYHPDLKEGNYWVGSLFLHDKYPLDKKWIPPALPEPTKRMDRTYQTPNTWTDRTETINGDILIKAGGGFTLKRSTLFIDSPPEMGYSIEVQEGGHLRIIDSTITAKDPNYGFYIKVWDGGLFELIDSEISYAGRTSSYRWRSGIYVEGPTKAPEAQEWGDIKGNYIHHCYRGLYMYRATKWELFYNKISNNVADGVYLDECEDIHVHTNYIEYNSGNGVYVEDSNKIKIRAGWDIQKNEKNGIELFDCSNSNNEISSIGVSFNSKNGINLRFCSGVTIFQTNIIRNGGDGAGAGIALSDSTSNTIYHNNFIANSIHAVDSNPTTTHWFHPGLLAGNYWDNYPGSDLNVDGIGDTDTPWPEDGYDTYPFTIEWGWQGVWYYRADMPTPREALAAAVAAGRLYALGGTSDPQSCSLCPLSTVEVYDPANDTWESRAPMPTPRHSLAAVTVDNQIYALGGGDINMNPLATVEVYDPTTDTWQSRTPMPTARRRPAAAAVNGRIYVIGGTNGANELTTVEMYNPTTDTWTPVADMPTSREGLAATVVDGKIYALGGAGDKSTPVSTVEVYNPTTDTWTRVADMPTPRHALAATAVGGRLYALGGSPKGWAKLAVVEEYNPATNTWHRRADMSTARWHLATAMIKGQIYAIGGRYQVAAWTLDILTTVEAYEPPVYDTDGDGLADKIEVGRYGTDPLVADAAADTDGDGLPNIAEVDRYGTDPLVADAAADTDGDGLSNVVEVDIFGTDPLIADADADTDGDGLTNVAEIDRYGTDPLVPDLAADTDGDGLSNVAEVDTFGTNPLVADADADTDGDGLSNVEEVELGTDPNDPNDPPTSETTPERETEGGFIPGFSLEVGLLAALALVVWRKRRRI